MLFLIDYSRRDGRLVSMRTFADGDRKEAYDARFKLERQRDSEGSTHEVVLLEAANEQIIRTTHSRYFVSDEELARALAAETRSSDGT